MYRTRGNEIQMYKKQFVPSTNYTPSEWENLSPEVKYLIFEKLFENATSRIEVLKLYYQYAGLSREDNQILQSVASQFYHSLPNDSSVGTKFHSRKHPIGNQLDSCAIYGVNGESCVSKNSGLWERDFSGKFAELNIKAYVNQTLDDIFRSNSNVSPDTIVWNCSCMTIDYELDDSSTFLTRMIYTDKKGYFTVSELLDKIISYYSQPFSKEELSYMLNHADKLISKIRIEDPENERYLFLTPELWVGETLRGYAAESEDQISEISEIFNQVLSRKQARLVLYIFIIAEYIYADKQWIIHAFLK